MDRRTFLKFAGVGSGALFAGFTPLPLSASGHRKPLGYLRTNWSQDPFSFGSYSYFAKGASLEDRKALAAPIENRIFFAGEAAHTEYNSTVHAAYESGLSAANNILNDRNAQNIAIIGAGISGLAAAHLLSDKSRNVTVLEGRDRIGGRLWTSNKLGVPLDLGASWIHGTDSNPLIDLAKNQNMAFIATDDTTIARGYGGQKIPSDDLPSWVEEVGLVQHGAGTDLDRIDVELSLRQAYNDYNGEEVIFLGGYQAILNAFQGNYRIELNHKVSDIKLLDTKVIVGSAENELLFDVVLVTVPLGVLKANIINFAPPLPVDKQAAIQNLGMGTLDKVYLQYDEVFWDPDVTWIVTPEAGLPQGYFTEWLNLYKYLKLPIIMAFNGASPALELAKLSDEEIIAQALKTLDTAYP